MTLYVDRRAGSRELIAPLQKMGLPVEEVELQFGDIAFTGRGEGGKAVEIGIEFKQLGELVGSLRTARLQGYQLPGMRQTYDHSWLLIEGTLLYDKRGQLIRRAGPRYFKPLPGRMSIGELLKRILVLHLCGGLNPWLTPSRNHTLKFIEMLYRVWTDEDLNQHKSHLAIYQAPTLVPVSDFRRAVAAWPRIGLRLSKVVEDRFGGSLQRAVRASVDEWATLTTTDDTGKTRKLGMKAAMDICQFLKGDMNGD